MANALVAVLHRALAPASTKASLTTVDTNRGWWPVIKESYAGAWQTNVEVRLDSVLAHHAVFACQTLIASDIAKLRVKLIQRDDAGIWLEIENAAYTPVLRKPNPFQTRIQFWESWILSKMQSGNVYVLKRRDNRRVVIGLYVLDPARVTPLVSDDGQVFYRLRKDNTAGIEDSDVVVPAEEIIHDRFNCLFHPLVGISPIFANGLTATQGLAIQNNATKFFENGARPGGILTAPAAISDETALRLKTYWDDNFSGEKAGKVAVLGDGLKYERMALTSVEAQLIEQLKWSAEVVCSTYHVPPYKIGVGQVPSYTNVQALNLEYYSQCLQVLIEAAELCLDEGLGLAADIGVEFDIDGLLRMDSVTQMDVLAKAQGLMTLDERRRKIDLPRVNGGNTIYLQQQDHSLEAIAARDSMLINDATAGPDGSPTDIQAEVFNGAQVQSLQGLLMAVAEGTLPAETAAAAIAAAFPLLDAEEIEAMIAPLRDAAPPPEPADDDEIAARVATILDKRAPDETDDIEAAIDAEWEIADAA
jgi:HK97 family phage portal protein